MGGAEFNKSMDRYISSRRSYETKKIDFSDIVTKMKPNKSFRIRPKIRETKIEFVDPDEIVHAAEQRKMEKKQCFFSRIFKRRCKKNVVDEDLNPVSEEFNFEENVEEMDEFDEDLAEIEALEKTGTKKDNILKRLLLKLRIMKDIGDKEEDSLKDEIGLMEEDNDDIRDEVRTLIDFSVDVLKILPAKDFQWIKEKESFQSYKRIVQKYMKPRKIE
ncbi:MAG: hypothetical protein KAQ83_00020 [Nanoarchaeota archaeon]|nr:hypothetical protein [Nanoarchaeota archaeon]